MKFFIKYKYKKIQGFTLIEGLVALAVFSIITLAFYSAFSNSARLILDSKRRLVAVAVANEQMEKLRNMPYANVGFDDEATPSLQGTIPGSDREKTITQSGATFTLRTTIQNIDDSFDGTEGGSPDDDIPNDSKEVIIDVLWGTDVSQSIQLSTRFSSDSVESDSSGGNLLVVVSDSENTKISEAAVRVTNLDTSEQTLCLTSSTGECLFIGLDEETTPRYRVSIVKSGYEYFTTYDSTPTFDPTNDHISVLAGQLQTKFYTVDRVYSITFSPREIFGSDTLDDVEYTMSGGRILGTDPSDGNKNVYALSSVDFTGEAIITDAISGVYFIDQTSFSPSDYAYWKIDLAQATDPFSVSIGTDGTPNEFTIVAVDTSRPGALLSITDGTSPISIASVRLYDPVDPMGYDHTSVTGNFGKVYFPHDESVSLVPEKEYSYEITATGYNNENGSITLGSELLEETIVLTLTPIP